MGKNNRSISSGIIVGRILSLPIKAIVGVGKITCKIAGETLGTAVKIANDTQSEYSQMSDKTAKEIGDVVLGKRSSTLSEKIAATKYVVDAKKQLDK